MTPKTCCQGRLLASVPLGDPIGRRDVDSMGGVHKKKLWDFLFLRSFQHTPKGTYKPDPKHQQFMTEFFPFWDFGDAWGMLQGYVAVLLDCEMNLFTYSFVSLS